MYKILISIDKEKEDNNWVNACTVVVNCKQYEIEMHSRNDEEYLVLDEISIRPQIISYLRQEIDKEEERDGN